MMKAHGHDYFKLHEDHPRVKKGLSFEGIKLIGKSETWLVLPHSIKNLRYD